MPSGDSYRPGSPPSSARLPLSSRFGDGPIRPRDNPPFARPPSPPRRMRDSSPQSGRPLPPFSRSPPSRNGDSYQPNRGDRAPPREIAERMDRDRVPPRDLRERMDRMPPRDLMDRGPPQRDNMGRAPSPPRGTMGRGPPSRDMMDRGPPPRDLQDRMRPRDFAEPMSAFPVCADWNCIARADLDVKQRLRARSPPFSRSGRSERPFERPLAERMSVEPDRQPRNDMRARDDRPRRN